MPANLFKPISESKISKAAVTKTSKAKSKAKHSRNLQSGRPPLLTSSSRSSKTAGDQPLMLNSGGPSMLRHQKSSSKATKKLINAHHNLHKARAKAHAAGKVELVAELDAQIEQLGGLKAYQHASLTGQSADRGGDSSVVLVKWLEEELSEVSWFNKTHESKEDQSFSVENPTSRPRMGIADQKPSSQAKPNGFWEKSNSYSKSAPEHITKKKAHSSESPGLRVLEIGALSSRNAISKLVGKGLITSVKRIDLASQEPDNIEEIDFMDFPLAKNEADKYDVISLSLVLNYVPDPGGRGEMLKRTRDFFRFDFTNASETQNTVEDGRATMKRSMTNSSGSNNTRGTNSGDSKTKVKDQNSVLQAKATISTTTTAAPIITTSGTGAKSKFKILPALFIVLPLPCLSNSRYMTVDRFRDLMYALGYHSVRTHQSAKLHYELFTLMSEKNNTSSWKGDADDKTDGDGDGDGDGGEGEDNKIRSRKNILFPKIQINPGPARNNFCITLL